MDKIIIERKNFSEIITIIMNELHMSEEDFACLFDASRSTVIRWKKRETEPSDSIKSILYETLIQLLIKKLKESRGDEIDK